MSRASSCLDQKLSTADLCSTEVLGSVPINPAEVTPLDYCLPENVFTVASPYFTFRSEVFQNQENQILLPPKNY